MTYLRHKTKHLENTNSIERERERLNTSQNSFPKTPATKCSKIKTIKK